eukprot:jgi/Tetstr1/465302/TSEL_010000.t1
MDRVVTFGGCSIGQRLWHAALATATAAARAAPPTVPMSCDCELLWHGDEQRVLPVMLALIRLSNSTSSLSRLHILLGLMLPSEEFNFARNNCAA